MGSAVRRAAGHGKARATPAEQNQVVAINARAAVRAQIGGVERLAREMVKRLPALRPGPEGQAGGHQPPPQAHQVRPVGEPDAPGAGLGDERGGALAQHLAGERGHRVVVEHPSTVPPPRPPVHGAGVDPDGVGARR